MKSFTALLVLSIISIDLSFACTRILNADNGQAVLVGRTMDWYQEMKTNLVVYPRGIKREGMSAINPLKWSSKYGSIVATVFEATTDGMNERGLAAHILWLDEADYGKRKDKTKGLSVALWAQFYLDNFQTVAEAIQYTKAKTFQLEPLLYPGTQDGITVHLALEDVHGDSAIIEYIKGKARIYHHHDYLVLTNSPSFDQQLKNLQQYKGFGGNKSLPGTTDSQDRFVRAAYYGVHLPQAKTLSDAVSGVLSVVQNISEPYGLSSRERIEIEPTLWRTVSDLTHKTYYFNSATNLAFIWTSLDKFNLQPGSPIMKLDLVNTPDLIGEVCEHFKPDH
jgi:choloylglycine hydrolase